MTVCGGSGGGGVVVVDQVEEKRRHGWVRWHYKDEVEDNYVVYKLEVMTNLVIRSISKFKVND